VKSFILTAVLCSTSMAQNSTTPSPAPNRMTCIRNVTVHTMDLDFTVIPDAAVVIGVDGRIERIVPNVQAPTDDMEQFDGQGRHLWPGFISSATTLGLIEVQQVRATDDRTEVGQFHPEVEAWVAVNPDSDLLAVARANGILGALVFPQGGRVSGTASMIRLNGWDTHDLVLRKDSGVTVRWPATEPTVQWWTRSTPDDQEKRIDRELREVREFFARAKAYVAARDAGSTQVHDLRFERLRPVLTGAAPIYLDASSAGQVASAVTWAVAEGLKPVIVGGPGALEQADLLRAHGVPVIIVGVHRLPQWAHEAWDAPFTLPARLAEAGIRFSIATGDEPSNDRNLPHHAATAVAHGLPHDRAVAAITRDAATIAGVGDQLGSIVPGMRASMILCSGDPLEVRTPVEAAWIDGRRLDLSNHQTRMLEKYQRKYDAPKP
jgi:imidazolonepropionase-like amidohydrolase